MSNPLIEYPLAVACIVTLVILYCANFLIDDGPNTLGLVTANTLIADRKIWNVITCSFYELRVLKLVFDVVSIVVVTRSLKIKGNIEAFGLYFGLSVLACSLGASSYCFIRFFSTGLEEMLLIPIYGFSGVLMTLAMYARQQLKGEAVIAQIPHITFNNLPIVLIILQLLLWLVGLRKFALDLPFSVIAIFFSWSYLRFFYTYEENSPMGDKSEEFAFVAMFPEAMHPITVPLSTAFYNIFAIIGLFPKLEVTEKPRTAAHHLRYVDPAPHQDALLAAAAAVSNDVIQERRRAKAMKLLDAKLAQLAGDDGWGDEKEATSSSSGKEQETRTTTSAPSPRILDQHPMMVKV